MDKRKIRKLVTDLLSVSGSSAKVSIEDSFPGNRLVGGKYQIGSHAVTMYLNEIKAQCLQICSSLDCFYDYFAIILAHELGHAEDQQLEYLSASLDSVSDPVRYQSIALKIEENAWESAQEWVRHKNPELFDTIVEHSLRLYKKSDQFKASPA